MTTNVNDITAAKLATDSRWSVHIPGHAICYIDDTGFDKIYVDSNMNFACSFAGNSILIALWKDWLATDMSTPQPPVFYNNVGVSICLMDKTGMPLFFAGQDIQHQDDGSLFAGSGARPAYECWKINKCAETAVNSAKKLDHFSGGSVVSTDFTYGTHNVRNSKTLGDVNAIFTEKGLVMYLNSNQNTVEFKTAAASDPKLQELARDLSAGSAQLTAPYDAMYQDWSPEHKEGLANALTHLKQMYR